MSLVSEGTYQRMRYRIFFCVFTVIAAGLIYALNFGGLVFKAISELRVRITSSTEIPEPTNIQSTGDWYFLDHISSGLAYYDSTNKTFAPMLALSWSEQADGTHLFMLRDGIKFHDGTPITGKDVLWSIKRHLLKKTSTHFPLWDYLVGCDHLKRLDEECEGLRLRAETEIIFRLKAQTDSFFLQLSSPETGIWSASDINPESGELHATKFSGPYFVESRDTESALLRRNENNKLSELFPESPRSIRIVRVPLANLDQAVSDHKIDVAIKMHSPRAEPDWQRKNIAVESTTPSQIIYLFGLGAGSKPEIGRNLVEALWQENRDPILSPADSFLPFSPKFGLSRSDFLEALPAKSSAKLRIMYPAGFFSAAFLTQFVNSGKKSGAKLYFHR